MLKTNRSRGNCGALFSVMVLAGSLGAVLLGRLLDQRGHKTITVAACPGGRRSLASSNPVGSHSACDDRCANAGGIRHHGSVTCPYCHGLKHRRRMSDDYDWPYQGDWRGSRRSGSDAGRSGWGGRPAAVVSGCVDYGSW